MTVNELRALLNQLVDNDPSIGERNLAQGAHCGEYGYTPINSINFRLGKMYSPSWSRSDGDKIVKEQLIVLSSDSIDDEDDND